MGDGPEFDRATWQFREYWDNSAALASSVLVFNTGRSIGQARLPARLRLPAHARLTPG